MGGAVGGMTGRNRGRRGMTWLRGKRESREIVVVLEIVCWYVIGLPLWVFVWLWREGFVGAKFGMGRLQMCLREMDCKFKI